MRPWRRYRTPEYTKAIDSLTAGLTAMMREGWSALLANAPSRYRLISLALLGPAPASYRHSFSAHSPLHSRSSPRQDSTIGLEGNLIGKYTK